LGIAPIPGKLKAWVMAQPEECKVWKINDKLPEAFVNLIKEVVSEQTKMGKYFVRIASDLGVNPATFSRWLAGYGPLTRDDIYLLATKISPTIFLTLWMRLPENYQVSRK
jgi:hypothetical protein